MNETIQSRFSELGEKLVDYLPSLFAGLVLILVGWFLGWLAKRVVVRMAVLLRLDRFITRFRWAKDFSKADVRHGFYSFLGNVSFLIIFLIFLNDAAATWKLTVVGRVLEAIVFLIPRILASIVIFGIGWLVSGWASRIIQKSLKQEHIPRATLITRFARLVLILFFSGIALAELNLAREVIVIGFTTIFVTLGILAIIITGFYGKQLMQDIDEE